jgi:peptide/nickel transport system substrate-binding protein
MPSMTGSDAAGWGAGSGAGTGAGAGAGAAPSATAVAGSTPSGDPDPDFILSVLTCGQINGWQDANYCDTEYDALYAQQHTELDREARAEMVRQMVARQYSEAPYAVLWNVDYIEAYRSDRWQGLTPLPAQGGLLWTAFGFGPYGSLLTVAPVEGS